MQIICNNCGNDLTFPNEQHLVTCPHCLTYLEIKELENTISATIVENPDFDDAIFKQNNLLANAKSLAPLYNLLHLENEYSESMEENFFRSILLGKRFRPVFFRAISRLIFGVVFCVIILLSAKFWQSNFGIILLTLYSLFLIWISIKEGIRWWRLRQFEKYFFKEQPSLMAETEQLDLSPDLKRLIATYQENNRVHIKIRDEYFYYGLFKMKIYLGTSVISQGFRLIPLGIIVAIIFANLFYSYVTFIILAIIFLTLFFIILSKSHDYSDVYSKILEERKDIIQQLNNYLSR